MAYGIIGRSIPGGALSLTPGFFDLGIGGSGFLTAMRIASDGTMLVRTDTYGGYYWDASYTYAPTGATGRWLNINSTSANPDSAVDVNNGGCYEIANAPSDPTIWYTYTSKPYKSTDRGRTWTALTQLPGGPYGNDPNAQPDRRFKGPKIAVHPTDPLKVYIFTESNGLYYSSNAGSSWAKVTSITDPSDFTYGGQPYHGQGTVIITPDGSTVYVTSSGHGLYKASVGGTFTQVTGGPGTTYSFMQAAVSSTNKLFLTGDGIQGLNTVWRYDGTTWVDLTPSGPPSNWNQVMSVTCDPNNANRIVVGGNAGGAFFFCTDADATTPAPTWGAGSVSYTRSSVSNDPLEPPWLETTNESYMTEGSLQFDPLVSNRLWFAEGIGVWYADIGTGRPSSIAWKSRTRGIEQLVATKIISTPTGALVGTGWDRAIFKWSSSSPDAWAPTQVVDLVPSINHGWNVEWASTDGNFLVAYVDNSKLQATNYGPCYSTDGGSTWTNFFSPSTTTPAANQLSGFGGTICAGTTQKLLWQTQYNNDLWYSANGGSSWTKQDLSSLGVPLSDGGTTETGWGYITSQGSSRHRPICADRGTPGIFWAYNNGNSSSSSFAGIYKLDARSGTTWTKAYAGLMSNYVHDFWHSCLQSVPKLTSVDTTGHLFYTSGQSGNDGIDANPDTNAPFKFSIDGGGTVWNTIANFAEVYAFGFGKEGVGKDYPTVFAAGWRYNGSTWVWGYYKAEANYSDWVANSVTWTLMTNYPNGRVDECRTIDGDKLIRGRVYLGFKGSGFMYGNT